MNTLQSNQNSSDSILKKCQNLYQKNKKLSYLLISLLLGIVLTTLIVNYPILSAKGVSVNDRMYLLENSYIKTPSLSSAGKVLIEVTKPSNFQGYYQPLSVLSLMLDTALGGNIDNLFPYHITNLTLHILNVILLFILLNILFKNIYITSFISFLYSLHPFSTELVGFISERKTLLGTFFALLTLILYITFEKTHKNKLYVFSLVAFVLCLLSAPALAMLSIAMIFIDYWPLKISNPNNSYDNLLKNVPFILTSMLFGSLALISHNNTTESVNSSLLDNVYQFLHNISYYLIKFFVPLNMSPIVPTPTPNNFSNPLIIAGIVILGVITILAILSFRKTKTLFYGIMSSSALLLPFMGLINFSQTYAGTKHFYFGSIGFIFIITYLLQTLLQKIYFKHAIYRKLVVGLAFVISVAILAFPTWGTRVYQSHWVDTINLNKYLLSLNANSSQLNFDLAKEYERLKFTDSAITHYIKAIELGNTKSYNLLGKIYESRNDVENASKYYLKAITTSLADTDRGIEIALFLMKSGKFKEVTPFWEKRNFTTPNNINILSSLGECYIQTGENEKALPIVKQLVRFNPSEPQLYKVLAYLNIKLNNAKEAEFYAKEGSKLAPDDKDFEKLLSDIATLSATTNVKSTETPDSPIDKQALENPRIDESITPPPTSSAVNKSNNTSAPTLTQKEPETPKRPAAYDKLINDAKTKSDSNDFEGASKILNKAINDYPDYEDAYISLGTIRLKQDNLKEAEEYLKKGSEINPSKMFVNHYLGILYTKLKKYKEAADSFNKHLHYAPKEYSSYMNLGIVYNLDEKPDKAIEMFKKAVEIKPDYSQAYYNWSQVHINKKEYDEALKLLEKALEINPNYVDAKNEHERISALVK